MLNENNGIAANTPRVISNTPRASTVCHRRLCIYFTANFLPFWMYMPFCIFVLRPLRS